MHSEDHTVTIQHRMPGKVLQVDQTSDAFYCFVKLKEKNITTWTEYTTHSVFSRCSFFNAILIQFVNLKWKKKMGLKTQSEE